METEFKKKNRPISMKKFLDPRKQNFRLKNDYLTTNYFFDINK